ncbi:hypothetical protein BGZ61DRAFT_525221 [Ilyonectria robusta]|uniref:uncharacterized protein n=1 Tax=Ilyonectria robusta TaxID=1079257 RepID=UPI001E8D66C7|nr:uncharacterized protein BGZ61DRAFT_525221 [Ilyonectria robusta]KAH8737013.1 hypothetical protein BGZ61DRAFT_525221 [Ilyonectria robusta]
MDSTTRDGSCDNPSSPPARSGPGSQLSDLTGQFVANSDITASPRSLSNEAVRPSTSSSNAYSSTAYLSTPAAHSAYLPTPASQSYSPFPVLSPAVLNSTWSQPDTIPEDSIPPLSHQQTHGTSLQQAPHFRQAEPSSNMSAVAIQYDPSFSMGPRSAFTWPGPLESHASSNSVLSNALSSMGHGSEPSLTPPMDTRSLTSSPPRFSLTAEQRELKRQQDKARRDTRLMSRVRRTSSPPYVESPSSAMQLPDASSAMSLPAYTTASASVSLMAEPAATMSTSPYLSSYSPSAEEQHAQATPVYPTSYPQSLQHNYNLPIDYSAVYAGPGHYSTRPTSLSVGQDVGLMYQVPAVMTTGGASSHEGGGHVRVVQSRPKPRCWEHGCNGRQFSTFSNLLRHQREKSGQAAKASCPNCGAEFTRTTARNGHLLHDKCKGRRNT